MIEHFLFCILPLSTKFANLPVKSSMVVHMITSMGAVVLVVKTGAVLVIGMVATLNTDQGRWS